MCVRVHTHVCERKREGGKRRERVEEGEREGKRSREGDESVCGGTLKASSSVDTPSPGPVVRQFLCVCLKGSSPA